MDKSYTFYNNKNFNCLYCFNFPFAKQLTVSGPVANIFATTPTETFDYNLTRETDMTYVN